MRSSFIIIIILVVGFTAWRMFRAKPAYDDSLKAKALLVSKHGAAFNKSISEAMTAYYVLTEAFVNWDTSAVKSKALELDEKLKSVDLGELKKDSSGILETAYSMLQNANNELDNIKGNDSLTAKRHSLNSLTQDIYDFLRVVKYDESKLYLQECPMAFNDTEPGVWLSKTDSIRNPYLGLHHPHYGSGMIRCGEVKDTLNFTTLNQ